MKKRHCQYFLHTWSFILLLVFGINSCNSETTPVPPALVDNIGYRLSDTKIAMITDISADSFVIKRVNSNEQVMGGNIPNLVRLDPNSGDHVRSIDFSDLQETGSFIITLNNTDQTSHPFQIKQDVYSKSALSALNSFYAQRCGISVTYSDWHHPMCHTQKAIDYNNRNRQIDVTGGWHDAGDYNKFAVTHNISIVYLLKQYLDDPNKYYDGQLEFPSSENGIPDILDEVRWGLEWLLKMQHYNGGIHHKASIKKWTGEHLPHDETDQQYVFDVSSTATAGAVGVFAMSARVFEEFDPDFTHKLTKAALAGWKFIKENPVTFPLGGFVNPPGVEGGEYGDDTDKDERLFASVEMYRLTGNEDYLEYFHRYYKDFWNSSFYVSTWQDFRNFAYYSYLSQDPQDAAIDIEVYEDLSSLFKIYTQKLIRTIEDNPYRYILKKEEFYWGSNSVAMGYAFDLLQAYNITGNDTYRKAALDQLHYILGRNPLGISFITGVGSNAVKDPYHQFSKLSEPVKPIPGMLVGGANYYSHLDDTPISDFTAKNYEDTFENYKVNEPAINYTASFSYVSGFFSDFKNTKNRVSQ